MTEGNREAVFTYTMSYASLGNRSWHSWLNRLTARSHVDHNAYVIAIL